MELIEIISYSLLGIGLISFFILANRKNYRTPSAAKKYSEAIEHYSKVKDKLTTRKEETFDIDTEDSEFNPLSLFIGIFIFAIIFGIGAIILSKFHEAIGSTSINSTSEILTETSTAISQLSQWFPIIFVICIITIILSIIIQVFNSFGEIDIYSSETEVKDTKPKAIQHYRKMRDKLSIRDE